MAYRILSLDGGGTWALTQVKALIARHKGNDTIPGRQALAEFDLIAANSGGSIVLGLLLEDLSLGDILAFFENQAQRNAIFSKINPWKYMVLRALAHFAPRYSADRKLIALRAGMPRYGNLPLSKVTSGLHGHGGEEIRVLITSFDYDRNRAVFFRSSPSGTIDLGQGDRSDLTLAEAIHASSDAPVMYFDGPAVWSSSTHRYWDGGIAGYNNPVMAGVVEAIVCGHAPGTIAALSIGTGSVLLAQPEQGAPPSAYRAPLDKSSPTGDLQKLSTAIVDDPPDAASFLAHVVTTGHVVRMSPLIRPMRTPAGVWGPPGSLTEQDFTFLIGIGMDAIAQDQVDAITHYADLWIGDRVPNQPIRLDGTTFACEVGYEHFSQALVAWEAII